MTAAESLNFDKPPDARDVRRAKLVTVLLLNSRSREDLFEHIEHMGVVPGDEIPGLYHDCVARLAHWKGLRRIGAAKCDVDLDTGFSTAVEGFYAGLMDFLGKGSGSERKMARARNKALKYTQQRCFVDDEETAARVVSSALDLLGVCSGQIPTDWIAQDPEKVFAPEPITIAEPDQEEVLEVVEPVGPQAPDNRTPIEKAADRLYGNRPARSAQPSEPPMELEVVEDAAPDEEGAEEPNEAEKVEMRRILEQATLLRSLSAWTRQEIAEDLLKHEILDNLPDAFEFIDEVFDTFEDPQARLQLLTSSGSEIGDKYISGITEKMQERYLLLKGLKQEKGYSREDLMSAITAMLDVPESFASVLIEMTDAISGMEKERG